MYIICTVAATASGKGSAAQITLSIVAGLILYNDIYKNRN
jgi:hypothetical protein